MKSASRDAILNRVRTALGRVPEAAVPEPPPLRLVVPEMDVPARVVVYPILGHRTLIGALAAPLRVLGPVLDDVAGFVNTLSAEPAARITP